jgi:hypothetical protein
MFKYLYLTEVEWSKTWVNGGEIPIKLASSYLNDERDGTLTPDENLIHSSEVDIKSLSPAFHFENVKGLTMTGCSINGKVIPEIKNAEYYKEDGLVLSFCNSLDESIANRLGKKCCVHVSNLKELRKSIDNQLGVKGKMEACKYTDDHNRNHFLKSTEDAWQQEYRMFWSSSENAVVNIPSGHAKLVATYG